MQAPVVSIDLTVDDVEVGGGELLSRRRPREERVHISSGVVDLTSDNDDLPVEVAEDCSSTSCDEAHSERKRARTQEQFSQESCGGVPERSNTSLGTASSMRSSGQTLGSTACLWCKEEECDVVKLSCTHVVCKPCLLAEAESRGRCRVCERKLEVSDLQGVLSGEEMAAFLDKLLYNMIENDDRFVQCPREGCANVIERAEEEAGELPTHAPDGQPLSALHAAHMQKNRYRCHACTENFCAACKQSPYHLGMTCEEAAAASAAVHCRFCSATLPKGSRQGSACEADECQQRQDQACEEVHKCGHRCGGSFGEAACLPCLECAGTAGDFCNICWTEELRAAPCVALGCGHVFHLHCLRARLDKRWPAARISFAFAQCPLCSVWLSHTELDGPMRHVTALRDKVYAAALERAALEAGARPAAAAAAKKEGRGSKGKARKRAQPAGGAGAGEVAGGAEDGAEALKKYNFYQCEKCKRPYFGGAAACGAVEAGQEGAGGQEQLMCGACSAQASGYAGEVKCRKHGERYVEFKCRFCCEVATFFCFGHTHFCEGCHLKWTQGAHTRPASLVKPCACQEKHPPNGTTAASEHCYGCSLCRIATKDSAPI